MDVERHCSEASFVARRVVARRLPFPIGELNCSVAGSQFSNRREDTPFGRSESTLAANLPHFVLPMRISPDMVIHDHRFSGWRP